MATLRELVGVNTDSGLGAQIQDENIAAGMGSLARGWTSGRIGNDANALRADELNRRAAGDIAGSDTLRGQIEQLQQRQQLYSPEVGRVEDIGGVGDAASWLGGQVGQGAASMLDPIAASAAIQGATRLAGMVPGNIGRGAKWLGGAAAMAAPYLINQRQLTGEFGNDAARDPELMARTSAAELRNSANLYGAGAAVLDTALPHMIGKQLTGAGLRQGLSAIGPGLRTLGGSAMEGSTEYLQGKASQFTHGLLNPNRDTSGDASEDLNNFAGGMAGGLGPSALGAYSDTGYRRVGNTAERLAEGVHDLAQSGMDLAGQARDAAAPYVQQAREKGGALFGRAKQEVTDLASGGDGKVSTDALLTNLRDVAEGLRPESPLKHTDDELRILTGTPPDEVTAQGDDATMDWLDANDAALPQLVTDKLQALGENPEAQTLMSRLVEAGDNVEAQDKASRDAAKWLLANTLEGRTTERASKLGQAAGVFGNLVASAGMAAGKVAMGAGRAMLDGAKEGMSKKNMQADGQQDEDFVSWRDRVMGPQRRTFEETPFRPAVSVQGASGRQVADQALAEGASYKRAQDFNQRAELAGSYAADMASRMYPKDRSMGALMRRTAYSLADMSESWDTTESIDKNHSLKGTNGGATEGRAPVELLRPGAREVKLNRIVADLKNGFGKEAPTVLESIGSIMGTHANAAVEYMREELNQQMSPRGAERAKQLRAQLANDVVSMVGVPEKLTLLKQGVNLHDAKQAEHVLGLMEDYADGIGTEKGNAHRRGLDALLGKESVDKILAHLNGLPEKDQPGPTVDDRGAAESVEQDGPVLSDERDGTEPNSYEQTAAEKTVVKGTGPKVYGFHATTNLRASDERRDPFGALEAPGEDGVARRPKLFVKGQQLFGGKGDAIEKKIADVRQQLLGDSEYPDHDNHRVEAKSARDVMKDIGMQPGKILQLFRDYSHADYNDEKASPEERKHSVRMANLAGKLIADTIQMQGAKTGSKDQQFRTTPAERKEVRAAAAEYFKNRFIVVGEQLSNRDPEKIAITELLALAKDGAGLLERTRGVNRDGAFTANAADVRQQKLIDANLIEFKDRAGKPMMIPAGKLVNWVRQQRGAEKVEDYSNRAKDEAYLDDVMTGVSTIMASGFVADGAWPTMVNKEGKAESFAKGIPSSLRLATMTMGARNFPKEQRLATAPGRRPLAMGPNEEFKSTEENDARLRNDGEVDYQKEVAADQMRQDDFFTPEDRIERDMIVDAKPRGKMREMRASDAGTELVTREAGRGTSTRMRVDVSGTIAAEPKTENGNATEMDFFPKKKDGQVPGDFDDQQWLTQQTNQRFEGGPEPKGTAASRAEFRAGKITEAFLADPVKGQEMIRMRLRMAAAPGYNDGSTARKTPLLDKDGKQYQSKKGPVFDTAKAEVVGGPHYIAPLAAFISTKNLVDNNIDLGAKAIAAIRQRVAGTLLGAKMENAESLKIARLMLDDPKTVTAMNYKGKLQRLVDGAPAVQAAPVAARVEPVAKSAAPAAPAQAKPKATTMQDLVDERIDYLRNPPKDYTPEKAQFYVDWAKKQVERIGPAIKAALDPETDAETDESMRLSDLRQDLRQVIKEGESVLRYDREIEEKMGPQGEVAAGLGKPRGGAESAVTVTDHQSSGYRERTKHNADSAGATVAIATDFTTAGERLTKSVAGDRYVAIDYGMPAEQAGQRLAKFMRGKDTTTLNIAGNGIYTLFQQQGLEQDAVNAYIHGVIAAAHKLRPITKIVSGGQTGVDIAGAVAAKALGIPAVITLPRGYVQRNKFMQDQQVGKAAVEKQIADGAAALAPARKLNAMAPKHEWMYHGTRAAESSLVDGDGNLVLKPSKNLGGKTHGVSFTHDAESAKDYATRIKGGGPKGFTYKGAKVLKIARDALPNIEEETFAEWADYSGDEIVVPKGRFAIEELPRERFFLRDSHLIAKGAEYPLNAYIRDNYEGMDREEVYNDPDVAEQYLSEIADPDNGHSEVDIAEAKAILRDEFGRGARNAMPPVNPRATTDAEMAAARTYAAKTLGPKIKVMFREIAGYSGEFIDHENAIHISTTAAAGTMGTLYHEAMHVFFRDFVKSNPKLQSVFDALVNDPKHLARLHALLDGYPAAQAQLSSGEERLAYTYQFWKAGMIQVDAKARTWMQKVGKFFRRVLGQVRDSEHALALFEAFDQGKLAEPSAAGRVIAKQLSQGAMGIKARRQLDGLIQGLAALTMPAASVLGTSASPTARRLGKMFFTNPGEGADGRMETGLLNARRNVSQQYTNAANRLFAEMNDVDQREVQRHLQAETPLDKIADAAHQQYVQKIRGMLANFHTYMVDAGMTIGKVENNYYPTVWNAEALLGQQAEFITMLETKYADEISQAGTDPAVAARRIWQSLVSKEGVDAHLPAQREDGVLNPFFASQERRTLPFIKGEDKERFLEKNMPMTLTRYFKQGAHAAEYFRRFGKDGHKLEKSLARISDELRTASQEMVKSGALKDEDARAKWHSRQMRDISMSVGAMEGTLGKDVSPAMRKFNSWMTVYQNVRLLPMSLFSSMVDPLALVARGAPMQAAYESFMYGMREVFRTWGDAFRDMPAKRAADEWRDLAEHIGASEVAQFSHHVSEEYASTYLTHGAKKINDKMFVINGMEAWNRGSRIMATKWGVRFLEKHAALSDPHHSKRWLSELGLTPSMLTLDDGKLVTNRDQLAALKGVSVGRADQLLAPVYAALNRWVEGAVLTPGAALRPAWSSDPNYATMFHLKQFSYAFHQVILKRATNEFKHGNMAPIGALAAFIPTMITADIMKGLLQGGGELPPFMKGWDAGDWFMHGVNRAGLSGIGQVGMDAAIDPASLGGPAFEQAMDALRDPAGVSLLNAAPLHSLYAQAVH